MPWRGGSTELPTLLSYEKLSAQDLLPNRKTQASDEVLLPFFPVGAYAKCRETIQLPAFEIHGLTLFTRANQVRLISTATQIILEAVLPVSLDGAGSISGVQGPFVNRQAVLVDKGSASAALE